MPHDIALALRAVLDAVVDNRAIARVTEMMVRECLTFFVTLCALLIS